MWLAVDRVFAGTLRMGTQKHGDETGHHGPTICPADLTVDRRSSRRDRRVQQREQPGSGSDAELQAGRAVRIEASLAPKHRCAPLEPCRHSFENVAALEQPELAGLFAVEGSVDSAV